MENYCLYCSDRGCDCSTHKDPGDSNCTTCGARKCLKNPLDCKVMHLNMEYYKTHPVEFIQQVFPGVRLYSYQKQMIESYYKRILTQN